MSHEIVIEAGKTGSQYKKDLWRYRELFLFFAWRDILVRYKQTVIGIAWAVIRPLLIMVVFTLIFGKLAKLPSDGVPYPILVYAAMLPWQFFASAISESGQSLVNNAAMVSKVYFPRLIVPTSAVFVCVADFVVSFGILIALMAGYRFVPGMAVFALPLFFALCLFAALGTGYWLCALNVKYRDFRYVIPFIVQFGLYVSPVGFSSAVVPEKWRLLYSINPMVGVIDGFRWALCGQDVAFYWPGLLLSIGFTFLLFVSGLWYFRKTEQTFADYI